MSKPDWAQTLRPGLSVVPAADRTGRGIHSNSTFLPDLRFHDRRHEATSCLFKKGLGAMEAARMTGHKSLATLYTNTEAEKPAATLGRRLTQPGVGRLRRCAIATTKQLDTPKSA